MKDLIGLFDMDNTLVDYDGGILNSLNDIIHPSEKAYTLPIERNELNKRRTNLIRNASGWWENLKRFEPGFEIYNLAKKLGFQPYIATKGPSSSPNAWTEKYNWVMREVPEAPMTITREKSLLYGRFLVDDFPEYLESWLKHRPRGIGIMPAHKYNEGFAHPNVTRYDGTNLDEVKEILLWAKNRK